MVLAATPAPADTIMELALLLDALHRAHARIHLILTYCGYARQDRASKSEALSIQVVASLIARIPLIKTWVVHAHSSSLHDYLSFLDVIPYSLFEAIATKVDVVAAPDEGAQHIASHIAARCAMPMVLIHKKRPQQEHVEIIRISGSVAGKRVLIIDDLIATGNTVTKVAQALNEQGAKEIVVAATHGLFSAEAITHINESPINCVYVSNSIRPHNASGKIAYVDLLPELERIVRTIG